MSLVLMQINVGKNSLCKDTHIFQTFKKRGKDLTLLKRYHLPDTWNYFTVNKTFMFQLGLLKWKYNQERLHTIV